jgi:hypothetical protein
VRASKGKYLSIGPDKGRCHLVQIRARWFHVMVAFVHPYILSHNLLFPVPKKKEREKKEGKENGGLLGFRKCFFSFPL